MMQSHPPPPPMAAVSSLTNFPVNWVGWTRCLDPRGRSGVPSSHMAVEKRACLKLPGTPHRLQQTRQTASRQAGRCPPPLLHALKWLYKTRRLGEFSGPRTPQSTTASVSWVRMKGKQSPHLLLPLGRPRNTLGRARSRSRGRQQKVRDIRSLEGVWASRPGDANDGASQEIRGGNTKAWPSGDSFFGTVRPPHDIRGKHSSRRKWYRKCGVHPGTSLKVALPCPIEPPQAQYHRHR